MKHIIILIIGLFVIFTFGNAESSGFYVDVTVNDDYAHLSEDDTVILDVLSNDYGLTNGVQSLTIVSQPGHGEAIVLEDNTIKYIPETSFNGNDEFVYQVCNTDGSCGQGSVEILVDAVDFVPVLLNDTITYYHSSEAILNVLSNDTLSDLPVSVMIEQDFNHGSSYLDADMNVVPSFNASFVGTDSLKYVVYDNDDDFAEAWVFVNVRYAGDELFIPNSFTPNGDGYNDYFLIPDFASYDGIELQVFDPWGQIVYKSSNYKNDWNGEGNTGATTGKAVNEGTYYYVIKLPGGEGVYTGYIFITR